MATNGEIPAADTEMAECDGEEVVTMMDVLKEQQDFEDDANAVLGGSDDKECTYTQGYIKRQAIYACLTCCPESKDDPSKRAGFCLACSLTCHENHELIELYTKRNFRCDCGNPKFKTLCQFTPEKPELNDENIYNQNFIGLYCICSKPYGEQESTLDDEMIQCVICEDWWHATHLDAVVPAPEQYAEMICKLCMAKNEFLHDYSDLAVNETGDVDAVNETGDVDVVKVNGDSGTEPDDKHTFSSLPDEKHTNEADKKLTNGIEEISTSNHMETDDTDATEEVIPESIDTTSTETESVEPDKLENVVHPERLEESRSDAPTDSEETDKAAEIISDDKLETLTVKETEGGEPTERKADSTISKEEIEESSAASIEETEESCVTSEEKTENDNKTEDGGKTKEDVDKTEGHGDKTEDNSAASANKTADVSDEKTENGDESGPPKESNESSSHPDSETGNMELETGNVSEVENPTEIMDFIESKVTKDQEEEINAETKEVDKNLSPDAETDKSSVKINENSSDKAKASETSQDEEINDISKETENKIVSEGSPAECISTTDEAENNDCKKSDFSNRIESDSNSDKVPKLASTEIKRKMSTEDDVTHDISFKKPKFDEGKCLRPKGVKKVYNGATFWPTTFRQKLCNCNECITMYKDLSVLFLTDLEDTVFAYETLGKEKTAGKPNQYEKGMEALCSLGRIQQIDALTEYNKMRDKLLDFLQSFKDKKEIVTEHDIKTFFAGMKPEKRTDGVYFCG